MLAPAKVNLYLKVLRKRDDGYHDIETLFERISIFDRLSVNISRDGLTRIVCGEKSVPTGEDSLLGRTIRIFKENLGEDTHFNVGLEKNIPISAGLGGPSSDTAALLKALNALTGRPFTLEKLLKMGASLGSDVPFFLYDFSFAFGRGRGDIIRKLASSMKIWHVLIKPPFGISSGEVYGSLSGFGLTKKNDIARMFSALLSSNNNEKLAKNLHNDLQPHVLASFPVLEKVFFELGKAGAQGALLSGSGPVAFGIFASGKVMEAARKLKKIFPPEEKWDVLIAHTY